jgi:hypothetical protein
MVVKLVRTPALAPIIHTHYFIRDNLPNGQRGWVCECGVTRNRLGL